MSQSSGLAASADPGRQIASLLWLQQKGPLVHRHPSVQIRQSRPEDAIAIWSVLKAAVSTLAGRPYSNSQIRAWIADEAPRSGPGDPGSACTVLVAESERRIIGFSRFSCIELEALYVHPARIGHKVGEHLLTAVERLASVRNIKTLALDAALNAVSFYESAGYRILGRSMPRFDNGVTLPCIRMEKTWRCDGREAADTVCDAGEISPVCPYQPLLRRHSRLDHWSFRAECCRAWRG